MLSVAVGTASGGITAAFQGANILQGALIGGFSSAVSFGIGRTPWAQTLAGKGGFGQGFVAVMSGGVVGGLSSVATGSDFWQGFTQGGISAGLSFAANQVAGAIEAAQVHDPATEQVTETPLIGNVNKKVLTRTTTVEGKYATSVTTTEMTTYVDENGNPIPLNKDQPIGDEVCVSTVTYDGTTTTETMKNAGEMPASVAKSIADMPVDSSPRDVTNQTVKEMNPAQQRAARLSWVTARQSLAVASYKAAARASGEMNVILYTYQNGRIYLPGHISSPIPALNGSAAAAVATHGLLKVLPIIRKEQLNFAKTGALP